MSKRIWLQMNEYNKTWCENKINKTDVEYIRADEVRQREKDLLDELCFCKCHSGASCEHCQEAV